MTPSAVSSILGTSCAWCVQWRRPPLGDGVMVQDSALQCTRPWLWVERFPEVLSHFCVDAPFEWVQEHGWHLLAPIIVPSTDMPDGNRSTGAILRGGFDAVVIAAAPLPSLWLPLLVTSVVLVLVCGATRSDPRSKQQHSTVKARRELFPPEQAAEAVKMSAGSSSTRAHRSVKSDFSPCSTPSKSPRSRSPNRSPRSVTRLRIDAAAAPGEPFFDPAKYASATRAGSSSSRKLPPAKLIQKALKGAADKDACSVEFDGKLWQVWVQTDGRVVFGVTANK